MAAGIVDYAVHARTIVGRMSGSKPIHLTIVNVEPQSQQVLGTYITGIRHYVRRRTRERGRCFAVGGAISTPFDGDAQAVTIKAIASTRRERMGPPRYWVANLTAAVPNSGRDDLC